MTSKQRAYLKSLAMTMDPIFQIGKGSLTPENTSAIAEALTVRELIKINVLQNCMDDPKELARTLAERTHSQVVQVIGGSIILYKENPDIENGVVKKKKAPEKKKSGIGKGAKDFKKVYNAKKKREEERQAAERARYSRSRRRNFNGGYSK